ncbi:peptidylprolyl isomerase [Pseudomonas sp. G11-1]|uniref:SurA N-terminal domain-containing protein n=1 Tax=Halopseudomonas sp. SMJS2 TaxID=3041098 RepID=UPI0006895B99|nr:SurA N-terminal domain-containing protein [Halopseudomonas sp. SMJS2]MCO5786020.1 peptidylprolyl isomerase [Pseudomonas sp. G11-1]MCO5789246.1 peptidylprolyl isomerase [Pseudomonas sp. G11-2]WGK63018.1 SurA N-terminal domain-containing protein [Halopseudomonas sp. SMJS2]
MMLQNMRDKAQSWVAKVIVGVIVLVFAMTGWESISRFTSNDQKAAEVNGTVISTAEFEQAVSLQRRQLTQQLQQLGEQFDPDMIDERLLRESVLEGLIQRAVLLEGAQDANLRISEQMVDHMLLNTPDFQTNGQFDANRFDVVIRNMGMSSRMAFRDLVRQELMLAQLRNAYQATSFATPAERQMLARLENQSRDFAVIELDTDAASVEVSDAEVEQYYNDNQADFLTEEQVVLETLTLSRSDFFEGAEVDEAALESLYQREVGNLTEQRRASHILFEVSDDEAAVLEEAAAVKARLDAGEDFAALAKEVSDDPGTSNNGGDMGYVEHGSFDPAFDDALFALEENQVSEPVRSRFGVHLVKLTDLQSPEVPSLESMRPTLEQELKAEQVERRFVEASRELANLAYESEDLAEPARILNVEVETHGPLERSGGEGLTANPRIMAAAFAEDVLVDRRNSQLIELDADTVAVVRVKEHLKPEQRPLDEVRAEIADLLQFRKASELAAERAEQWVTQLEQGELDTQALAAELGNEWQVHEAISRSDRDVTQALLRNVFTMSKPGSTPEYAHFRQPDGSQWIVELRGVSIPEEALAEADSPMYGDYIAGQTGEQDFAGVQQQLQDQADIERF